jgi:hypothetical protein
MMELWKLRDQINKSEAHINVDEEESIGIKFEQITIDENITKTFFSR